MTQLVPDPQAPPKRTGIRVGIGCLTVFSLFMVVGAVVMLAGESKDRNVGLAFYGILAILAGGGAYLWFRSLKNRDRKDWLVYHERIVVQQIASAGGNATLAQIVQGTPLSATQAEEVVESLSSKGLIHLDLLDDGTVLYKFGVSA
jgi:hypothetical protein